MLLDAFGTEWDYCPRGRDCVAGAVMGLAITLGALAVGFVGRRLWRRGR